MLSILPVTSALSQNQGYLNSGINKAQETINAMPPGALKDAQQAALDAFKAMNNAGKVGVAPGLGKSAETTAEGPGGSTSGVGLGAERIDLGTQIAGVGEESGLYMDPDYSGQVYLHEGQRCLQTYSVGPGGRLVTTLQCIFYWLNEAQVYFMDAHYWFTRRNMAMNAGNEAAAARAEKLRSRRAKTAWDALFNSLSCL